jgi:early secretory antigenic target protein ESAT-6
MELDGLKVIHLGLDSAAEDLVGIVDKIDARLQRLEQDLQPLRAAWAGEAQLAYVGAKQRWDAAITEMRDLLRHTSEQVTLSNSSYRAADARGARAFDI